MGRIDAATFFSPEQLELIRQAVVRAEESTAGEIATMVVDASDSYREAEMLGGVLLSSLLAVMTSVLIHQVTIWSYLPLVVLLFIPSQRLFRLFPRLKLSLMTRMRLEEAVRERAVRAFYEKGLYRTRGETGILIFISLLEHKVWILGDRGINARIAPRQWREMAADLAHGFREGRGCEALCHAISRCGEELARHLPRHGDDLNELGDSIIS
jgi:putative membrane protein